MTQRVLVLGAGFAGFWAAVAAARRRDELGVTDLEIRVVTSTPFHDIRVRNYEADLAPCRLPLAPLLDAVDVRLELDQVERIDVAAANVQLRGGRRLEYDRIVVALGSRLVRPDIPGLDRHGFDVDTYDAAMRLDEHLHRLATAPPRRGSATVAVVGAGLTGIEVATTLVGRLATLWHDTAQTPRVMLLDHHDVGSDMGAQAGIVIGEALDALGVEARSGVRVAAVLGDGVRLDTGETIAADTVIWCAGMRANPLVSQLPGEHDRLGRVVVDECLRAQGLSGVFVAGDAACAPIDAGRTSVMSCQHSRPMGRFAGHNAVSDLYGRELLPLRIPWYVTVLDLGDAGAVYTEGWDRHVVATGSTAKATKRVINTQRIYPPGVDRSALLAAAAPVVQMPPAYGA